MEKAIIELYRQGKTHRYIANTLHVGLRKVGNVIHFYKNTNEIMKPPKRGRKPTISENIKEYIEIRTLQDAALSSVKLASEINDKLACSISHQYVSQLRNDMKFRYTPQKHQQELTEKQIQARKIFCQKMLEQKYYLDKIAFSDESRFVFGKDSKWVWMKKGEYTKNSVYESKKFPQSVMVFAIISPGYKSKLVIIDGTVDQECYIRNLIESNFIQEMDEKFGKLGWLFMQDGAKCHTAERTVEWLEQQVDLIIDWPPNSPDLNPIELLWAILKRSVAEAFPRNKKELVEILEKTWNNISQSLIDKLCLSFENRLILCNEMNGLSISRFLGMTKEFKEVILKSREYKKWSEEEDLQLYNLIRKLGHRWTIIAKNMENRNPIQCKSGWFTYLRNQQPMFLEERLNSFMLN